MKQKKKTKTIIITVAAVLALLAGAVVGASYYMLGFSLTPNMDRPTNDSTAFASMYKRYPFLEAWVDSLNRVDALRDTFIVAPDGARLHAYYIAAPEPTPKTAVAVHGYTDNAIRMMMIGYLYNHELRYNVLLPELRHHGRSDGSFIGMGWTDRHDVERWMEVANIRFGGHTLMVAHGISMGAATVMMLSGDKQPPYVKCFVEDCGYTSVWDEFAQQLREQFSLPPFPLMYTTSELCELKYGWNFREASALTQVARCALPMLFIHGDRDTYVPTWMVYSLYDAKPQPKELWIVPGAEHAISYLENMKEYTERTRAFTERYLVDE
ncbi:MAG: alpha/beta hydrolase [Mediterranea sp.]|jgi:fermentation-respiration switch protein FrsA (DUF1100 family)|nr:alpha/beta hydrolase [Mediterranea sp.]